MKRNIYFEKFVNRQLLFFLIIFYGLLSFVSCNTKRETTSIIEEKKDTTENIAAIGLELIADSLTSPVTLVEIPDNSGRLFIVDQIGLIKIIAKEGKLLEEPFLDLQNKIVPLKDEHIEATSDTPSAADKEYLMLKSWIKQH